MLDLELLRLGKFAIARLKRRDHAAALVAQRARFVERGVEPRAHEAAVAPVERQFVGERTGEGLFEGCVDGGDVARACGDVARQVAGRAKFRADRCAG